MNPSGKDEIEINGWWLVAGLMLILVAGGTWWFARKPQEQPAPVLAALKLPVNDELETQRKREAQEAADRLYREAENARLDKWKKDLEEERKANDEARLLARQKAQEKQDPKFPEYEAALKAYEATSGVLRGAHSSPPSNTSSWDGKEMAENAPTKATPERPLSESDKLYVHAFGATKTLGELATDLAVPQEIIAAYIKTILAPENEPHPPYQPNSSSSPPLVNQSNSNTSPPKKGYDSQQVKTYAFYITAPFFPSNTPASQRWLSHEVVIQATSSFQAEQALRSQYPTAFHIEYRGMR